MSTLTTVSQAQQNDLESALAALKQVVRDSTPNDLMQSIEASVATMSTDTIPYQVSVSCIGSSDAGIS
jgi:hypothetical protein